MRNPLSKTPFLSLLVPLIVGILLQYYLEIQNWSIALFFMGIMVMLLSYFIHPSKQFKWRWLFGAGVSLFVIGIGVVSTAYRQQQSEFSFSTKVQSYRAIVIDTPQEKPQSIAYKVQLVDQNKQIVCYFQRDTLNNKSLNPGDEFLFDAKIQPFKNRGGTHDFDYLRYMYDKGFAGSAYVASQSWQPTGIVSSSFKTTALRCRQQLLDFYQSLGFNDTEYAILSALTLGYQDALSDDLKQGFRTTGTVHVLSVSGLHVGIIYLMISFLLGFIRRHSKYYWVKPVLIILLLWVYAFITGLPPSVVRASAMLTVFCVSEIFQRKSFPIHALYIAAFFMLLINPLTFFDIGFQLSFSSVLAILYLHPKACALWKGKNKCGYKLWQMFSLSLVAQLGTFPLCLYYFGTFPTYFFVANLLIVPLTSLIMYAMGGIVLAKLLSLAVPTFTLYFYYLPVKILQILVKGMTSVITFFEKLPFALVEDANISFVDLFLILIVIWGFLFFFIYKKPKVLIATLIAILLFFSIHLYDNVKEKNNALVDCNIRYFIREADTE